MLVDLGRADDRTVTHLGACSSLTNHELIAAFFLTCNLDSLATDPDSVVFLRFLFPFFPVCVWG